MNTAMYKGIIFDFNGVLWWDSHLQERSWKQFSVQLRGYPLSLDEIKIHVHGRNNPYTLEYLTGRSLDADEIFTLTQQKEDIYRQMCLSLGEAFRLSPGATGLLDFLVANRIAHTIATASEKTNVDFFVRHLQLEKWFDLDLLVYDNGKRPGKPAPDIYLRAASNLGLELQGCIVVEDSLSGIQAAHTAGIGYIIALGPRETHADLAAMDGVDEVIENLVQVRREALFYSVARM
jgi:beta-phosphoglucomutase